MLVLREGEEKQKRKATNHVFFLPRVQAGRGITPVLAGREFRKVHDNPVGEREWNSVVNWIYGPLLNVGHIFL